MNNATKTKTGRTATGKTLGHFTTQLFWAKVVRKSDGSVVAQATGMTREDAVANARAQVSA